MFQGFGGHYARWGVRWGVRELKSWRRFRRTFSEHSKIWMGNPCDDQEIIRHHHHNADHDMITMIMVVVLFRNPRMSAAFPRIVGAINSNRHIITSGKPGSGWLVSTADFLDVCDSTLSINFVLVNTCLWVIREWKWFSSMERVPSFRLSERN